MPPISRSIGVLSAVVEPRLVPTGARSGSAARGVSGSGGGRPSGERPAVSSAAQPEREDRAEPRRGPVSAVIAATLADRAEQLRDLVLASGRDAIAARSSTAPPPRRGVLGASRRDRRQGVDVDQQLARRPEEARAQPARACPPAARQATAAPAAGPSSTPRPLEEVGVEAAQVAPSRPGGSSPS